MNSFIPSSAALYQSIHLLSCSSYLFPAHYVPVIFPTSSYDLINEVQIFEYVSFQEAIPLRQKAIHIVNAPNIIHRVFAIMKPFISKEMMKLVRTTSTPSVRWSGSWFSVPFKIPCQWRHNVHLNNYFGTKMVYYRLRLTSKEHHKCI